MWKFCFYQLEWLKRIKQNADEGNSDLKKRNLQEKLAGSDYSKHNGKIMPLPMEFSDAITIKGAKSFKSSISPFI